MVLLQLFFVSVKLPTGHFVTMRDFSNFINQRNVIGGQATPVTKFIFIILHFSPRAGQRKMSFLYFILWLYTLHSSIHDDYHPLHCAPGAHSFSRFSRLLGFSLCIDISPSPPPSNCRQIFKWNQINPISVKEMENFHENISKI